LPDIMRAHLLAHGAEPGLLTDREKARARGRLTYMGVRCLRGHPGERYASTGQCVECRTKGWGSPVAPATEAARAAGARIKRRLTYHGAPCVRCGSCKRYASSGGCRDCTRKRYRQRYQTRPLQLRFRFSRRRTRPTKFRTRSVATVFAAQVEIRSNVKLFD